MKVAVIHDFQSYRHHMTIALARSAGEQAARCPTGALPRTVARLCAAIPSGVETEQLAPAFGISAIEVEAFVAGFKSLSHARTPST